MAEQGNTENSDIIKLVEELLKQARSGIIFEDSKEAEDDSYDRILTGQEIHDAIVRLLPRSREVLQSLSTPINQDASPNPYLKKAEPIYNLGNSLCQVYENREENLVRFAILAKDAQGKPIKLTRDIVIDGGVAGEDGRPSRLAYLGPNLYKKSETGLKLPRENTVKVLENIDNFLNQLKNQ